MPGTILLDDLRDSIQDQLHQHVQSLLDQASQVGQQVVQPVQAAANLAQIPAPIQAPNPNDVQQALLQHVNTITQSAQQAAAPAVQVLGQGQQQAGGALTELGGQAQQVQNALLDHVQSLTQGAQSGLQTLGQPTVQSFGGADQAAGDTTAPDHEPSPPLQTPGTQIANTPGAGGQVFPLPIKPDNNPSATYHSQGGSDLMAPRGTPVLNMQAGKVEEVFTDNGSHTVGGNAVLVHGDDGLDYYYAHFDQPSAVKVGQRVDTGEQIGAVGNSGNAFKGGDGATHLHIGIGHGISNGVGSEGGLGENFNAQALLTNLQSGIGQAAGAARTAVQNVAGDVQARVGQGQKAFVDTLQPLAQRVAQQTGIDPNAMLAIAANETGWGQSQNAQQQNNLFSIQGDGSNGSRWASYKSPQDSFNAFVNLISSAPRYAQAWADRGDPARFVDDLRHAGYVADEPGFPAQGWVDQVKSIYRNLPVVGGGQADSGGASAQRQAAVANEPINLGSRPAAKAPLVMGGMQDAQGNPVADTAPTPIQTAQDALGGAAGAVGSAVGQVASDLGSAAQGALGAVSGAVQGAVRQATAPAVLGPGETSARDQVGQLGQTIQDLNRRQPGTETVNAVTPVLGGVASDIGTGARGAADTLGGAVAGAYGLNNTPEQRQADTEQYQRDVQAAAEEMNRRSQQPITPGSTVSGAWDLIIGANPPMGVSLKQYQDDQQAKNLWIEQNNPFRDMTLVGGLTTGIAQQLTDPLMLATFGPTLRTGAAVGEAVGGAAERGITQIASERLAPEAIKFAATVADKLTSGAIIGGVQNALMEAEKPDATPESVFTALWQGAGFGAAADLGGVAAVPVARRIGQALIDRAPEIQAALRSRQRGEVQVNAALGGVPEAVARVTDGEAAAPEPVRTPAGRQRLPNYDPNTPEGRFEAIARPAREISPDGLLHLDLNTLPKDVLPVDPTAAPGSGIVKANPGGLPHTDDLRSLFEANAPKRDFYSDQSDQGIPTVGPNNLEEWFALNSIMSQRTGVTTQVREAIDMMGIVRQVANDARAAGKSPPEIRAAVLKAVNDFNYAGLSGSNKRIGATRGYATGVSETGGIKTPTFAGNYGSAESRLYDPGITNDIHNWRAMNIDSFGTGEKDAANNPTLYRGTEAVFNELGAEQGVDGYAFQSAVWDGIRAMQNHAPAAWKEWQAGNFQKAIADAKAAGIFNRTTQVAGAAEPGEISRAMQAPGVKAALARWGDVLKEPLPPELGIDSVVRTYPGEVSAKGIPKRGAEALRPASLPFRQGERAVAESYAPVVRGVPGSALERLGVDDRGIMPWLATSHRVVEESPGSYVVHLPAGNSDTARYVASEIGRRVGAPEMAIHYPDYRAPDLAGVKYVGSPEDVARIQQALADAGHATIKGPTGRSLQIPLYDEESMTRVATTLQRHGIDPATLEDYNGVHERIPADAYAQHVAETGGRFAPTTAERRGLLERAGSPVAEPDTGAIGGRQSAQAYSPFAINVAGGVAGGAAGNAATPQDAPLDVRLRNIGLGASAGLVGTHLLTRGGTGSLLERAVAGVGREGEAGFRAPEFGRDAPRPGEGVLRATTTTAGTGGSTGGLADVRSNPHLLREAGPGETPMTMDERLAHGDTLSERYQANADRLNAIDEQLRNPGAKPERPPWAGGFTNDQVAEMAAKVGRSAYEPLWWEKAGLETGSGEVRALLNESGISRGDRNATREPTPADLRRERAALLQDQEHLQVAGDQQATLPDNANMVRPPERTPVGELPFSEGGAADAGSKLAQEVVTRKGGIASDEKQVVAVDAASGVGGRGIVNPAEVVREAPSAETQRLMPNLSAIGKDMPEVIAQIQKSAEDNPALWEHYKQGTITFDSLKNDLAARVGMSKEDWLKTKVGQAFNDQEMVALQAAMIEEQARQTDMARTILARGGVDNLTPEELAYSITTLTQAQALSAIAGGAGSTAGRALNARKVSFDRQLASSITAANELKAAQRIKAQASRVSRRATELLAGAVATDKEKAAAVASATREGAPKNIIDQIAAAYDELDRYNAMSLHEKADVFDKLKAQREAAAAARKAAVRGAPEELLSALKAELKAEQDNFAKRKSTWETMAFQDSKAFENMMAKRTAFRGGLYIETQRKSAQLALQNADKEVNRAFDAEIQRRGKQGDKAQKLLESMGGTEVTRDVLKRYIEALNDPDPMVAAKFLQSMGSMSNWARATTIRLAGLLSSPITQMVNIGGNVSGAIVEVPTRALVVGIDALRAAVTGGERQAYAGELLPMLKAYGPGALGALPEALRVMKTGITAEQLADPTKIRGRFSPSEKLNFGVEAPLRALQAEDVIFRQAAFSAHGMRVASRQAIREGFKGKMVEERAATILKNLEDYPELAKEAQDAAARQVFQERRTIPGMGVSVPGEQGDISRFASSQVMPFVRTPMNITAQGAGMSPLGIGGVLQAAGKARNMPMGTAAERAAQGRETLLAEERAARAVIGSMVLGGGLALGGAGMLTAAYPADPTEASTLPQGWRPWSLRLTSPVDNNTYYIPLQNMGPMGMPLAMASILTDPKHRDAEGSILDPQEQQRAVMGLGRYVIDNTFLQGISDMVDALHDPKTGASKFLEPLAASYGPYSSLARESQRMMGVASRNPHDGIMGLVEAFEADYPGLSGNVPEATTPLGEPRTQGATGLARTVPFRYDIERDNATLQVLRDNKVGIPPEPKQMNIGRGQSLDLTEDEQALVKRDRGAAIKQAVDEVQQTRAWQSSDLSQRNALLKQAVNYATQNANIRFYQSLTPAEIQSRAKDRAVPEPYYLGAAPA